MMDTYFIPISLNELMDSIRKNIDSPNTELNGEELIYGTEFISGEGSDLPQNSVIFHLVRTDPKTGEEMIGCLYVTPRKRKYLM